jgi:hypothetical protein
MTTQALRAHVLVLAASVAGVIGMGLVFDGAMSANLIQLCQGIPLLMVGLWWAGRELGRSMTASRSRRIRAGRTGAPH